MTTAWRYHDISTGHRVPEHEGTCKHLHGHNYRIHFAVRPVLRIADAVWLDWFPQPIPFTGTAGMRGLFVGVR